MSIEAECPICLTRSQMHRDPKFMGGSFKVECSQCGPYTISDAANSDFKRLGLHRGRISGTIRRRADSGTRVIIASEEMEQLALLPPLTFKERMEGYLLVATNQSAELGGYFAYGAPKLIAGSFCSSKDELNTILEFLVGEGHLKYDNTLGSGKARITAKGHMACDELQLKLAATSQGFIAMWFDETMQNARKDGLEVGIRNAGYRPHRVDDQHHIDAIDDRIIAD